MKQSGARSAPGKIWGVYGTKQPKHREMKQSGARSAPGKFWGISGPKQQKHGEMLQSGARSAPGKLGYLVCKSNRTIGNHQPFYLKTRCGLRKNANRFKKTLQGCGLLSSQGALKDKRKNKTVRFRGHDSSIPCFIFLRAVKYTS